MRADDYYIATSTFEWFPGCQIHHSRDLRHHHGSLQKHHRAIRSAPANPILTAAESPDNYLRLYGRESLASCFRQSLIVRRLQAHHTVTSTCLEFQSHTFQPCFTGTFVGLCCQDLSGRRRHADFDWFEYREIEPLL